MDVPWHIATQVVAPTGFDDMFGDANSTFGGASAQPLDSKQAPGPQNCDMPRQDTHHDIYSFRNVAELHF